MFGVVHHARAPVERHGFHHAPGLARLEPHIGLGLRHVLTQGALQCQRLVQGALQGLAGKLLQRSGNCAGLAHSFLLRVAVDHGMLAVILLVLVGQPQQQFARHLIALGRAKTDGVGHALAFRNAVVRPARWQVEHVARLKHILLLWHKVGENLQWHALLQVQVLLAPDAPAALAMGLQQEYVVAVEVGPHTATVGGVADHQIVQTRLRHKAELLHQRVHGIVVQIYALHQQSPARRL